MEKVNDSTFTLTSSNVHKFSILTKERALTLTVDGQTIVTYTSDETPRCVHVSKELDGWEVRRFVLRIF